MPLGPRSRRSAVAARRRRPAARHAAGSGIPEPAAEPARESTAVPKGGRWLSVKLAVAAEVSQTRASESLRARACVSRHILIRALLALPRGLALLTRVATVLERGAVALGQVPGQALESRARRSAQPPRRPTEDRRHRANRWTPRSRGMSGRGESSPKTRCRSSRSCPSVGRWVAPVVSEPLLRTVVARAPIGTDTQERHEGVAALVVYREEVAVVPELVGEIERAGDRSLVEVPGVARPGLSGRWGQGPTM
jgi:hypothetical protein